MTQVRVIDEKASVHSETDITSPIVAELHAGDEFSIGKTVNASGVNWCAATLSDGKAGYVAGTIKVFRIRPVTLAQSTVDVLESPAEGSRLKATYRSGDKFTLAGAVKGETQWAEVRTDSGEVGFVRAGTKIKEIADPQADSNQINIAARKLGFVGWALSGGAFFFQVPGANLGGIGAAFIGAGAIPSFRAMQAGNPNAPMIFVACLALGGGLLAGGYGQYCSMFDARSGNRTAPADAGYAPASKTTCDRCGNSVPSGFYLEKSQDGRYLCEKCRAGLGD